MAEKIGITDAQIYKDLADLAREKDPRIQDSPEFDYGQLKTSMLPLALSDACDWQYEVGYNEAQDDMLEQIEEARTEGIEQGKQDERTAFWNMVQRNGARTDYQRAFTHWDGNEALFTPLYKIAPSGAQNGQSMFFCFNVSTKEVFDFSKIAHMFDFSKMTNASYLFQSARIDNIIADLSSATTFSYGMSADWYAMPTTTTTLKVSEKCSFSSAFYACRELTNLTFMEGSVIGKSIDLKDCTKLTKASLTSVMTHLSPTATLTATFSKTAVNKAFETSAGSNDGSTSEAWLALVNAVNATISLV